jgi:glyoxylase-like metal-dependent hydrolase (beta-lactamase superfamily II)
VLVDTAITVDQNQKLVDWIAHSGKNLTTIYTTHGHGDHFFGVNTIQKKFPKARFVATREVIAVALPRASESRSLMEFGTSRQVWKLNLAADQRPLRLSGTL